MGVGGCAGTCFLAKSSGSRTPFFGLPSFLSLTFGLGVWVGVLALAFLAGVKGLQDTFFRFPSLVYVTVCWHYEVPGFCLFCGPGSTGQG